MGRSRTATVTAPNHRDLNDDEMGALVTSFTTKVIDIDRREAQAAATLAGIRKEKSGVYKLIKKETGYDRKEFEAEVIDNLDKSEEELAAAERRRLRLQVQAGLREGEQLDLIEHVLKDTVDDAIAAEAAGYRAGRRADDPVMPDHISSMFLNDWQRGWTRGQEVNAKADAMAAEILAARARAGGELTEGEDDEDPEREDIEDALDDEARRLKASGWANPTNDEASFETAA